MARDISRGINVTQSLIALGEGYLLHGNFKDAAVYAGAVGLSNLVSANGMVATNATTEKYVVEPLLAAGISAGVFAYMGKKNVMKRGLEAFLIGGSSAGVNMYALNFTNYGNPVPDLNSYQAARNDAQLKNKAFQSTVIA